MLIAVGSHSRKTGKSSLVCELVRAIPEARWTVVKISGHEHGVAGAWSLEEEHDAGGRHDTSRYLEAGAARAWLLRHSPGGLTAAVPALRQLIAAAGNTILESNRILEFIQPDLHVFVRNEATAEFKESARAWAARADVTVLAGDPESLAALVARIKTAGGLHW
ncbi:MAG TPA: hypothetical protein VHA11_10545 [Bryobacteraceae bacterium]|nr:hypothetical protein [Bryobacteraceae bacterium]